jgi:hypothetical protein
MMKLEHEHHGTHGKTFFYTTYRISFSHKYRVEKFAVPVYISPSFLTTVRSSYEQVKQAKETREET